MKSFLIFIPLFLVILSVYGDGEQCAKEGSSRTPSLKIKKSILCNYDKEYRPVQNQKLAINVSLRLVPKYFDSVSEEDSTMDIQNWLGVVWKDEFLKWDPSEYNSVKNIHISSDEIWTPDIKLFKDSRSKDSSVFSSDSCLVTYEGYVSCVLDSEHEAFCTNYMYHWPYDTRSCDLVYTTGIYNSSEIKIIKSRIIEGGLQPNPSWELLNSSSKVISRKFANQVYQQVKYNFQIKRHSSKIIAIIFVPAISLITMTLIPLWLHPENTERFCLVAANILSHFLFLQHLGWIEPGHGNKLPPAVAFFRDSLGMSVAILIELTLVKSLLANQTAAPGWLLTPCKFISGSILGKTLFSDGLQEIKDENTIENENKDSKKKIEQERILIVSVVDRILFFVLLIVYIVLVFLTIPFN